MQGFFSWIESHATLVQAIGVLIALLTLFHVMREREEKNSATLKDQHARLWSQVTERDDLKRILSPNVDLKAAPVTLVEQEFLNLVFVHFEEGWKLAKQGSVNSLETLALDQGNFTSLPIPYAVWEHTKSVRNPEFVCFVEQAVERSRRNNL